MKKSKKPSTPRLNNEEAGIILKKQAAVAECGKINEVYERFCKATAQIESGSIEAGNYGREIGLHLQTLCGHEQLSLEFWNHAKLSEQLKFDFSASSMFVSLARKIKHPLSTIQEAVPLVQQCLVTSGLLEMPSRTGDQHAVAVGIFQRFLSQFAIMRQLWSKCLRESPMKNWEKARLRDFLGDVSWIVDDYNAAKKLLEGK